MEQKSSNTLAIAIIALAGVLVVAMICGMLMWMVDRNQSFNERLLDRQLAAQQQAQPVQIVTVPQQTAPVAQPVAQPVAPVAQPKAEETPAPKAQPAPAPAPKAESAPALKATTPAKTETKPAAKAKPKAKPQTKVETVKRPAPQETEAAKSRVGSDGQPLHRITLPIGNDDLDWQLQ